jgi:hypothetical protein
MTRCWTSDVDTVSLRFFAQRCSYVDAVNIEPEAIEAARRYSSSTNIRYQLLDAVGKQYPRGSYDMIGWDGTIGHFAPETTHTMLEKIQKSLSGEGMFVVSESLGRDGHNHLQFFETVEDMDRVFHEHFPFRAYRVATAPGNLTSVLNGVRSFDDVA